MFNNQLNEIKLTQYSHGAGWGCKLSPEVLAKILAGNKDNTQYSKLLMGNQSNDDAAAYQLDDDTVLLSTTDFFMPIVDDPFDFGRIAACNAISDIYAMGGQPVMAVAILGWPIAKLPADVAAQVMAGGRDTCKKAGIPLAGGHSIDSPEPIFGLAVNGVVKPQFLKTTDKANANCQLYLTKPLGIGILTTAKKRNLIIGDDLAPAIDAMTTLNKVGQYTSDLPGVMSMTDITGFGLIGHLSEMCLASGVSAVIDYQAVPQLPKVSDYFDKGSVPGGTKKNVKMYQHYYNDDAVGYPIHLLCDAQTSGGLLIAVDQARATNFEQFCQQNNHYIKAIGHTTTRTEPLIEIKLW